VKPPAPYDVVIPLSKVAAFHACRKSERKLLLDCLDRLARNPSAVSDWLVKDSTGRPNFQVTAGRFVVTFWPDHAAREVRILKLDRVD
jgi:hypothetical protein